jgi:hypothetical protein
LRRGSKAVPLIFSVLAVFLLFSTLCFRAEAQIFYASSNYSVGSAGVITKDGSFAVHKNLITNLGGDAWGVTFNDHSGAIRAMIREYSYGPNDTVYVYDPANWTAPVVNTKDWGSNFHAAASNGQYLYLTTYESYASGSGAEDTGEVVRVDMKNGYARDKAYQYPRHVENGHTVSPHAEAIHIENGKIYVLFGMPYNGVNQYEASEIVEFDAELNVQRTVQLKDSSGHIARNAVTMAYRDGKLYVAAMGGYQGPNSWGDIWQVDILSMTAKQVLDGHDIPYTVDGQSVNVGLYGVDFADDGTAYVLAGSYSADYSFRARLFVTTESRLAAGDAGRVVQEYANSQAYAGYSWGLLWDEADSTLWCMTGRSLEARDKAGSNPRSFTPAELGDNVYSISLLNGAVLDDDEDNSGNNGNNGDSGGGGGGCDTRASGLIVLLVLVSLAMLVYPPLVSSRDQKRCKSEKQS